MCTMNLLPLYLLCLLVSTACAIDCTPTKGKEYCSCIGKDFIIDMSKILELPVNNIPDAQVGSGSYTYNFSPCEPVACVSGQAGNGIVCQTSLISSDAWYLGRTTVPPVWNVLSLEPTLSFSVTYSGGDKTEGDQFPRERQAVFIFEHGNPKDLEIAMFGETAPEVYQRYTFVGTRNTIAVLSRGGGSGVEVGVVGLVLIILFIVAVVTYFFIGAIVNYHYRGSRGAEVIPNYTMWKALPSLVKDGFLFAISPCYKKEKYEKF